MATWSPAGAIAPVGQRSRQRVQPTIFEREWAQRSAVNADVTRLVEAADEVARLEHGLEDGRGIAGIGAQIAVAQIRCGEQRCAAGEVEHEIAARHRAVACRCES